MRLRFILAAFLFSILCHAQKDSVVRQDGMEPHPKFFQPAYSFNKKRCAVVVSTEAVLSTGTLIALSQVWYKDYPRTTFHSFNDKGEWLQMDKIAHATTAYTIGKYGMRLLEWS